MPTPIEERISAAAVRGYIGEKLSPTERRLLSELELKRRAEIEKIRLTAKGGNSHTTPTKGPDD